MHDKTLGSILLLLSPLVVGCGSKSSPAVAEKGAAVVSHTEEAKAKVEPQRKETTSDHEKPAAVVADQTNREPERAGEAKSENPGKNVAPQAAMVKGTNIEPATWSEAEKVIDLRTFPLAPQAAEPTRNLAGLNYAAQGTPRKVYAFFQEQLKAAKWSEEPNSVLSDDSCSGVFAAKGFHVSLTTFAQGKPNETSVMLLNHGNIDPRALPQPANMESLYASKINAMFVGETKVAEVKEFVTKSLLAQSWEPYGEAGDVMSFRKNAVLVQANISEAPAQAGKTMLSYSTQLLSHDFPLVPEAFLVQYSEKPAQIGFDVRKPYAEIEAFYRTALEKRGWMPTTEKLVAIDWKHFLIFRNDKKELIELELTTVEEVSRAMLRFKSAEEMLAEEHAFQKAKAKAAAKAATPLPKIKLTLPENASEIERQARSLSMKVPSGKGESAARTWVKELEKSDWKLKEGSTFEPMAGVILLSRGEESLTINYIDTGILPTEITVNASGCEFETK